MDHNPSAQTDVWGPCVNRRFRLRNSADFKRVRRSGTSYAHPLIVLIVESNPGAGVRVGVAAGKSVGDAVQRNRAKRLLRAGIAPLLPQIKPDVDVILIARQPLAEAKAAAAQEAIRKLLLRARLIEADHHGT